MKDKFFEVQILKIKIQSSVARVLSLEYQKYIEEGPDCLRNNCPARKY